MPTPESQSQVIAALENTSGTWQTLDDVVAATGLPLQTVLEVIRDSGDVIESDGTSKDGKPLYTTRKHFREKSSIFGRILAALRNRAS